MLNSFNVWICGFDSYICSCFIEQGFYGPYYGQHKAHPKLLDANSGAGGQRAEWFHVAVRQRFIAEIILAKEPCE